MDEQMTSVHPPHRQSVYCLLTDFVLFTADLHVYVDIGGQILSCPKAIKIWNSANADT